MSAIIDPTGIILAEAGVYGEELLVQDIDPARAEAVYAGKSLRGGYALREMWEETYPTIVAVEEPEQDEEQDAEQDEGQPPAKRAKSQGGGSVPPWESRGV